MNPAGQVVGCYGVLPGVPWPSMRAYVFAITGGMQDLSTLVGTGDILATASGINDEGWIVGDAYVANLNKFTYVAKPPTQTQPTWTLEKVPDRISLGFANDSYWSRGTNNSGDIIGVNNSASESFVITPEDGHVWLDPTHTFIAPNVTSIANRDANGVIPISGNSIIQGLGENWGWRYTGMAGHLADTGVMTALGVGYAKGDKSGAMDINDPGWIAGWTDVRRSYVDAAMHDGQVWYALGGGRRCNWSRNH